MTRPLLLAAPQPASSAAITLDLPGTVEAEHDAMLASASGGLVEKVLVEVGDAVKAGQALARVNTSLLQAQRDQAAARAELAKAELARVEALGDMASEAALQRARTDAAVADAALRMAEIQLRRSVIRSPFDGLVAEVRVERGEVAAPGAPVVRVVDVSPALVRVSVSDRDLATVHPGAPAQVLVDAAPEPLAGSVRRVSPAATTDSRSFLVDVEVPNADARLLPGMVASVRVGADSGEPALVIPQDWLVTRLEGNGVFVADGVLARWRPVRTGALLHDQVVITDGLEAGDRVVITGQRDLQDGDPLLIAREGTCCENGRAVF